MAAWAISRRPGRPGSGATPRIAPIYEGTNGIQAIDLVLRKLPLSGGGAIAAYIGELAAMAEAVRASNRPAFAGAGDALAAALADLREATDFLLAALAAQDQTGALAGATAYLRLAGLTAGAVYLAKGGLADGAGPERAALARFMAETILPETAALKAEILSGGSALEAARIALS